MISAAHVQLMARYNGWQNRSIYRAAALLPEAELARERGAFFGSIFATLNHILWADEIWMSRFTPTVQKPTGGIAASVTLRADFATLRTDRTQFDALIEDWAGSLSDSDLSADLSWYSGAAGRDVVMSRWISITHFFNHQTHHRGQVHAMLTAAGARPDDTDLFLMPGL